MQKVEHEPGSRPDHAMDFLHIFPDTILLYTTYPSVDRYIYIYTYMHSYFMCFLLHLFAHLFEYLSVCSIICLCVC